VLVPAVAIFRVGHCSRGSGAEDAQSNPLTVMPMAAMAMTAIVGIVTTVTTMIAGLRGRGHGRYCQSGGDDERCDILAHEISCLFIAQEPAVRMDLSLKRAAC